MKAGTFVPGPWIVKRVHFFDHVLVAGPRDMQHGLVVLTRDVFDSDTAFQRTAQLVAAAPEMYALLESLMTGSLGVEACTDAAADLIHRIDTAEVPR